MGWTLGRYIFQRYMSIVLWLSVGTFSLVFIIDFAMFPR